MNNKLKYFVKFGVSILASLAMTMLLTSYVFSSYDGGLRTDFFVNSLLLKSKITHLLLSPITKNEPNPTEIELGEAMRKAIEIKKNQQNTSPNFPSPIPDSGINPSIHIDKPLPTPPTDVVLPTQSEPNLPPITSSKDLPYTTSIPKPTTPPNNLPIPTSLPQPTPIRQPDPPPQNEDQLQLAIIAEINLARKNLSLTPLSIDSPLQTEAKRYSQVLASKFTGCHTFLPPGTEPHAGVDGTNPFQRWSKSATKSGYWGEVIAIINDDPAIIVNAWMNSPGHRKAITGPSARKIGLGRSGSCTVGMIGL